MAPTYPSSSDVTSGQATLSAHYNNLRADALRLGAGVADGGTLGDLLTRYSRNVLLALLGTNQVRVAYTATRVPTIVVNGYILRATADVDSPAISGSAGTRYIFAKRTSSSTTFTLTVDTTSTEDTDERLIGQLYWDGSAIAADSIQSEEHNGLQPLIGRCNLDATSAPTANDDALDGYGVGSVWVDVSGDRAYLCLDATAAAAVWGWMSGGLSLANGITVTVTGGGVLALGGYTLTVPATGTAALLGTAQTFSALQTFSSGIAVIGGSYAQGRIYRTATDGTLIAAYGGSTNDFVLINNSGQSVLEVASGAISLRLYGDLIPVTDDSRDLGGPSNRWDDVYATNSTIQTSDERDKRDIEDASIGLAFIRALRPVTYRWKDSPERIERVLDPETGDEREIVHPARTHSRPHYGLIAQEVKAVMAAQGILDFAGYIYDEDADRHGLRYGEFLAPIIKSIQDGAAIIEQIQAQVAGLESRLSALEQA